MANWNLTDAKQRFSELVTLALKEGPQRVIHSQGEVFVISARDYDRLKGRLGSFKEHLRDGASFEGLDWQRDNGSGRD